MRIIVEDRHIQAGIACVEEWCPIALAILEALWGERIETVAVGCDVVSIFWADGTEKRIPLAWEISEIIDIYDSTGVMYPFGFEL